MAMRKFFVLSLLFFPLLASADCTDHLQAWAKTLQPELKLNAEHAVCKINPANAGQILAALPFAENVDEDGQGDYGLAVIVANSDNGKIIAHHYQAAAIVSDAISLDSLAIDTARYQLAPKLRAFGVRMSYQGSSRVNPFNSTVLNLYLNEGPKLRPISAGLVVSKGGGEWDGNCTGEFSQTERTLSIADKSKNGLASLQVDEKTIDTAEHLKGDECESVDTKPAVKRYLLEYNGNEYGLPSELKGQ
ncbi:hypothetical protein KDX38_22450 [Pseudomonas sp. CDFA 602]|uniref:hypothetical protein n=1 Tax=Pseudomonas californiensis TaxID=2829823 RepID=UPI001E50D17F|nr:hypothetical protein [Pseudomonas californiensis]MCD5996359.1 hypothetical protein [Pseudomonas californiensis]MCD6001958.1 hypothetical protein [Pseudomonas californiensis]